jgi:hypothetical protein
MSHYLHDTPLKPNSVHAHPAQEGGSTKREPNNILKIDHSFISLKDWIRQEKIDWNFEWPDFFFIENLL